MALVSLQHEALLQIVQNDLQKIEAQVKNLRSKNTLFIYTSLICSALGTILAGLTAALGPVTGQGPGAWKITCAIVAGFTGSATVLSGLHQRLAISDRLAKANACLGKLSALRVAITVTNRDLAAVAKEYEDVVASSLDVLG